MNVNIQNMLWLSEAYVNKLILAISDKCYKVYRIASNMQAKLEYYEILVIHSHLGLVYPGLFR